MSKSTISTFELFAMFPDQDAARVYLEGRLWPKGPVCPCCGFGERVTARKGKPGFYLCNQCKEDFTVRTGTVFERSHIPLNAWIVALGIVAQSPEVSSAALAHGLGITQKSAWFVLQRLREACGNDPSVLSGFVEIHEMYVGGKERDGQHPAPRRIVDLVLAYRPKGKGLAAAKVKRKIAREIPED